MQVPAIGIPVSRPGNDAADYAVRQVYCEAIAVAGGAPVLIPPQKEDLLARIYTLLDGLLLSGGGDVANTRYGNPHSESLSYVDPVRDELELTLTHWALRDGLPLLGICRGIQVLNVAAGGTLIQDIPSQLPGSLVHSADRALPRNYQQHDVQVQFPSLLAAVLSGEHKAVDQITVAGLDTYGVNSYHHQAVDRLAPGFRATAHAPDGIIEAIEAASSSCFVLGVQWHPECMVPGDAAMERLFYGFVAACRR